MKEALSWFGRSKTSRNPAAVRKTGHTEIRNENEIEPVRPEKPI